jgi:hypothetical protein
LDDVEIGGQLHLMTNDGIKFNDNTIQTTAYTGGGSQNIDSVLLVGDNCNQRSITNCGGIDFGSGSVAIDGTQFPSNNTLTITPLLQASTGNVLYYNTSNSQVSYNTPPVPAPSTALAPYTITITPNPSMNLDVPATFSYITNAYGNNSALPVSVYFTGAGPSPAVVRQNLCNVYFGAGAYDINSSTSTIQLRYTNSVSTLTPSINCWELNTFIVNVRVLYTYGAVNVALNAGNATLASYGILNTLYSTGNYNPSSFYTNPAPIPYIWFEFIPGNNYFTLFVKNEISYFNTIVGPITSPGTLQANFNLEILNNSGKVVNGPSPEYSTAMVINTA